MSSPRRWWSARCSARRARQCRRSATRNPGRRRFLATSFFELRLEAELLDLSRQRIAAPTEPCGGFHPVSAGVRERAADQRLLEFLLEPIADVALAANECLCKLAIERLLPTDFRATARATARDFAHFRREIGDFDALPGPHHGHPVADVLELANISRKRERCQHLERVVGQRLR